MIDKIKTPEKKIKGILKTTYYLPMCFGQAFIMAWKLASLPFSVCDVEFDISMKFIPQIMGKPLPIPKR